MRQRGKAKTKGRSPGLHEEHHCQRQGRRGRLIWQSRSQQIVTFLGLGLIFTKMRENLGRTVSTIGRKSLLSYTSILKGVVSSGAKASKFFSDG